MQQGSEGPVRRYVGELRPQDSNPRTKDPAAFAALVASVRRFGLVDGATCAWQPVIVNVHPEYSGLIVGGEMRWRATQEAGYDQIWVREVVIGPEEMRDFTIILNVPAGEWDWERLEQQVGGEQAALLGLGEFRTRHLMPRMVPVEQLAADPDNARHHDARSIAAIARSLERFGQQKPIVVSGTRVLAGNGTLEAARQLGWQEIAVVRSALEGRDAAAFALADNRAGEVSAWDLERLSLQLKAFEEDPAAGAHKAEDLGWQQHEAAPLLRADWTPPQVKEGDFAPANYSRVTFSPQQRAKVNPALAHLRATHGGTLTDAECLVEICEEWMRVEQPVQPGPGAASVAEPEGVS